MTADRYDVLIVGAGQAGAHAAMALRQRTFKGTIGLLGDESDPPYERPPLSKEYLSGTKSFERILIRPPSFWGERAIDLLLGRRVVSIFPDAREVACANGAGLGYGTLIWAAGGVPRQLVCSGHDLRGVHAVRNRADVDRMMAELDGVRRIVVIGGGYIGLEAAAVLTKFGKTVTLLEAQDRVLARVAGEPLSRFFEAAHRDHGVDLRLGVSVTCIEERDGAVCGVSLADGGLLPCEMVIVGVGIVPAVEPLLSAGAEGGNGVDVDVECRTSVPHIFAIGDCAAQENRFADGARVRVESVQNANHQAAVVANTLTGGDGREHADAVPWFWSSQYDLKLQTVGLSIGFDTTVLRGNPDEGSFSIVYLKKGRVIALDCVNAIKDYVQGRTLVVAGATPPVVALADLRIALKDLVAG